MVRSAFHILLEPKQVTLNLPILLNAFSSPSIAVVSFEDCLAVVCVCATFALTPERWWRFLTLSGLGDNPSGLLSSPKNTPGEGMTLFLSFRQLERFPDERSGKGLVLKMSGWSDQFDRVFYLLCKVNKYCLFVFTSSVTSQFLTELH